MLVPSRKQRPSFEVLCELVYRPLAHVVVLALLPLRVPPPAVVAASALVGIGGAVEIGRGNLLLAALLLQVKTVLDNADGQLARASGRVTAFGIVISLVVGAIMMACPVVLLKIKHIPYLRQDR